MDSSRLFVGNLPGDTKEDDLKEKFSPYGRVLKVELKERKFLQPPSCFGFVTVGASKNALQKCIYDLSDGYAWNGHPVTVDFAKESFLSRLEKERLDPRNKNIMVEDKLSTDNSNSRLVSAKPPEKISTSVGVNKKKVFSDQDSSDSESSETSENDSDDKLETSSTSKKSLNENAANILQKKVLTKSKSSESEDSSESDSDNTGKPEKLNHSSVKNTIQKSIKVAQNSTHTKNETQSKQDKCDSSSESDSDEEEININTVVNSSNDVMKQFEQFSSVWQDSTGEEDNQSDSSEGIFEAFKIKPPNETSQDKEVRGLAGSSSIASFSSDKQSLPKHEKGSFSNEKESPEHNKSGNFVKFVKTRQPQVQSKTGTKSFAEFKLLNFPKFESKNSRIVFDSEHGLSDSVVISSLQSTCTSSAQESNSKPLDSQVKTVKVQAKNHVDAENKRRIAMEERSKDIADKRKAIKQALANVDSQKGRTLNKKIIFSLNSDDEETDTTPASHSNQSYQHYRDQNGKLTNEVPDRSTPRASQKRLKATHKDSDGRSQMGRIENEGKMDRRSESEAKKRSLFDESGSESEDGGDSAEEFKIKKQFEGEKGLKLLELQASYNNDTRFNLDDRFADDVSDKEREMDENEGVSEKEKQMQILEDVLGYKVKQHQTQNGLLTIPRFDPLNPDSKSLLQVKAKSTRDPSERKRKRKPRDEPVQVSDEKFYQLDEAYFNEKQEKESVDEPFSLLKMLNRETSDDIPDSTGAPSQSFPNSNHQSKLSDVYRAETLVSSNPFASVGARFEYDSSDSEDEEENNQVPEKRPRQEKGAGQFATNSVGGERAGQFGTGLAPPPTEKLFFLKDDDRFKEAQEFLRKRPSNFPQSDVDSFKLKRRELALKLKIKIRRNVKNSGLASNMKRRKKTTKMMKTQRRR